MQAAKQHIGLDMTGLSKFPKLLTLMVLVFGLAFITTDFAEAKRGFGGGSRGARTFSAPKATRTAPKTAPLNRTMTPNTQQGQKQGFANSATNQKRGFFGGGFMGSMLGGLALGGLIGMLMGNGIGGFGGFLGLLVQGAILFFVVKMVMGFLRRRQQPQAAAGHAGQSYGGQNYGGQGSDNVSQFDMFKGGNQGADAQRGHGSVPNSGSYGSAAQQTAGFASKADDELGLQASDFDSFEELLTKIWTAYGKEDYAAIRAITTPEMMGFFAEDLGQSASKGLINEVREIKLLQGDLSESWREGSDEYATVAMRYSSIDVMRERATNKVVEGNPDMAEEVTEVWTFIRQAGQPWKLSAIQQV